VPRSYKEDNGGDQVSYVQESVERGLWVSEAEESPLLEADAREQLVKTQQAGKGLVVAVVFLNCGDQQCGTCL
jgi:hypothetical protein